MIRIDSTLVADSSSFYLSNELNDGGTLEVNAAGPVALKLPNPPRRIGAFDPRIDNPTLGTSSAAAVTNGATINMERNPADPFGDATFAVNQTSSFANNGSGVSWIPFDLGGSDEHRIITMVDPTTGLPRLIVGNDAGVYTALDNNGSIQDSVSANGNLQITQFYYGAAQPTNTAALESGAVSQFYGDAQDNGAPQSAPNVLGTGDITWSGPRGDASGVATDQTGTGTVFKYEWPCCGGGGTDFFQVNGVGKTNGLITQSGTGNTPDPQWPFVGGANFAVNPIDGDQIIISDPGTPAGNIYRTEDQGNNWFLIGNSAVFGGSYSPTLAFGAPDTSIPNNGSLDNFIYAGTSSGQIYVTQDGGGANGNNWTNISAGLDGSAIQEIVPSPLRGSHEVFAATASGVYFLQNSIPTMVNGVLVQPTWVNLTGDLLAQTFNAFGDPTLNGFALQPPGSTAQVGAHGGNAPAGAITSLAVDWRYVIPNDLANPPVNPTESNTHPLLFVSGTSGVYVTDDINNPNPNIAPTWNPYPSLNAFGQSLNTTNISSTNGYINGLPNAFIDELSIVVGAIDPTTGRAVQTSRRLEHPARHHLRQRRIRRPPRPGGLRRHGRARPQYAEHPRRQ